MYKILFIFSCSFFGIFLKESDDMYKNFNNTCDTGGIVGRWCCPDPCNENTERKNTVNINNNISINQTANAQGGSGGEGGNATNGDATGGSAAAASGLIAVAANVVEPNIEIPLLDDLRTSRPDEKSDALANGSGTSASGGSATIGSAAGGAGGSGGNGGTATNSVTVAIDNIIIISNNSDGPGSEYKIGMQDRTLDFKVDENGDTYVNGKRMDSDELDDGTKVYIFKNRTESNS